MTPWPNGIIHYRFSYNGFSVSYYLIRVDINSIGD